MAKYLGAKLLRKQLAKDKKKKTKQLTKGALNANQGEYLKENGKRQFDLTASSMAMAGDFEDMNDEAIEENPEYLRTFDLLVKSDYFLLTQDEALIGDEESETDDEQDKIQEMLHRANTETMTLFKGVAGSNMDQTS